MIVSHARFMTDDQVRRTHDASLEILAQVGLLVRNSKARDRLARHGCAVDTDTGVVTFPAAVVEEFRAMVPATFTLRGRDPAFDLTVPRAVPAFTTASSAPDVLDPVSGQVRRATSADIARLGHLVNELDGFDVFSISVLADDAPAGQFSLSRFYPALKNCVKPCRTSVIDLAEARQVLALGELIAGSPAAYAARPFITFGHCPVVSPLTMDFDSTEMLMFFAENGIPNYGTIAPIGGLSAPLSLPGMMAQMNAEWLAMAALAQMSGPGTPMLYNFLPVFADMRDGAFAPGGIETAVMAGAVAAMGRFYGVPTGGYLGLTNATVSDAQAGFEKAMAPLLAALAGIDYVVMGGLTDALMCLDYAQLAIDDEIALMVKRAVAGLGFDEAALSLDEIRAVGPGGIFVDTAQTFARMKTATLLPRLANRLPREVWAATGATDIRFRALEQVRAVLTRPNPRALAPEVDARVRAAFDGLVAGDSVPPAGWTPPHAGRGRRQTRRRAGRRD
ncbi:MAG: trimethylamine methyltransferase family protein [Hyphomicrobiales bacterium]|nr:trimethylamine methyltransferase family protein [Hyphomicrobiales bacterium]MCP5370104.1 trimethylamine methyltransferase family protein [Hyphomicrobiales bacterium]